MLVEVDRDGNALHTWVVRVQLNSQGIWQQ